MLRKSTQLSSASATTNHELARSNSEPAHLKRKKHSNHVFWLQMSPALIVLLIMTIAPAIFLISKSFTNSSLLDGNSQFMGLKNYQLVLTDSSQLHAARVTAIFVVLVVLIEMASGLFFAQFLYKKTRANSIAGALLIIPFAVAPAVAAMIFRELLNPNYGWIDYFMGLVGLPAHTDWLGNSVTAWSALVILDVWQWTPFVTLILIAGMSSLPAEPLEAAAVDGANAWQIFRHISVRLMAPFIGIALVLRTIQAFKTFDSFLILTGGGPGDSTSPINLEIYRVALQSFRVGYASAMAILLLIVTSILTPALLRILGWATQTEVDK
jgi:multiple sugar transport system permease protein